MTRVRFRHTENGEIRESDLIICTQDEWEGTPESAQGVWSSGLVDLSDELQALLLSSAVDTPLFFALRLGELNQRVPLGLKAL
jgi:hypothetical protein